MTLSHLLLALLANLAFAFNFIAGKIGADHFQPLLFTALRFSVLAIVLLPWLRVVRGQMHRIVVIALLMGVLHFWLMFSGLAAGEGVSAVALASQLQVPFATLLAWLVLGEHQPWKRLSGTVVAFAGVMLIGFDPVAFEHLDALLYVAGAAFVFALCTLLMKDLSNTGVCTLQAWIAVIAFPPLILLSYLFEDGQIARLTEAHWTQLATPVYSALGASLVGHGIVYFLVQRYPIGVTAPTLLLSPVIAVAMGVTLFNEALSLELILGGLMTLGGVAIICVLGSNRSVPQQRQPLPGTTPDALAEPCAITEGADTESADTEYTPALAEQTAGSPAAPGAGNTLSK